MVRNNSQEGGEVMKRIPAKVLSLLLATALVFTLFSVGAAAGDDKPAGWWSEDVWSLETLQKFGAAPPAYNASTGKYEISSPGQLLFLSGAWKTTDLNKDGRPDAPRNGSYVLTKDLDMKSLMAAIGTAMTTDSGAAADGYMPPISANKDENDDKTDGWFLGTFDGQYHTISNLCISRSSGKYSALFGYVGNDADRAAVRDLGLVNVKVTGGKTCGAIAGVSYGAIENCFATGSVQGKETVGGLVGKVKEGLDSHMTNCFAYLNVTAKASLVGGLTATLDGGGTVDSCYAGGTVTAGDGKVSCGGAAGSFSAGEWLKNTVALQTSIAGGENAADLDRLVGTLESESGANLTNNFVWEGTSLGGNEPQEHPARAVATLASAAQLLGRSLYADTLGWDFSKTWTWVGSPTAGYPMLAGFVKNGCAPDLLGTIQSDLTVKTPVLNLDNPAVSTVPKGSKPVLSASLVLPAGQKASSVEVFYGKTTDGTAFTDSVPMTASGSGYTCTLPLTDYGTYYYYVKATVGAATLTVPYSITAALPLTLDDGKVDGTPRDVLCQVGQTYAQVGLNWLTDPAVTDSTVWYRLKGAQTWSTVKGTSALHALTAGWEECQSHWATLTGLRAETAYEYRVGGTCSGTVCQSPVYSFTTLPSGKTFTFMQYSDMQAEEAEGYTPFLQTLSGFVDKLAVKPDFLLNTGDIVASGYKTSQWETFFDAAKTPMADRLNILLPGNHENKGDLLYQQYGARTSLPNEDEYAALQGTGWCVVGDACIVFVNSDPYSGQTGADVEADRARFFQEQTAWAKQIYENSGCTWRIMASHVGTYIVNFSDPSEYPYIPRMCDELQVDLYLNGHDHEYIRTSVKGNEKTALGGGTTYVTSSSLGEKLDAFLPDSAGGKYAVVHQDGAENSQQIFSMVTVDTNGIHLTAYQRGVDADWSKYSVIDQFDITTSLTKGPQAQTAQPGTPAAQTGDTTYVVVRGDCLYRIARKFYGDGNKWGTLYAANRSIIQKPELIYVGQKLTIPAK